MSGHTPGPWAIDNSYQWPGKVRAANGRFVADASYASGSVDENIANAALIAAAPETAAERDKLREVNEVLVAALEECLGAMTGGLDGKWSEDANPAEMARAALSRAESLTGEKEGEE